MNSIAEHRKKIGASQSRLAAACNWGQSRIANYEAGFRTPVLSDCRIIVKALNKLGVSCQLDDVFPPSNS